MPDEMETTKPGSADEAQSVNLGAASKAVSWVVPKNLNESGLEQLFETAFTSPEATRAAVRSLIDSFDDKGLWLASLVQPAQLTAELRQDSSDLTTLILTQWVRQGETHKLKQLGESLLAEEPKRQTHEGARIMAVLAGLLGILRPVLAQRLLAEAAPRMTDSADVSLMRDARQWVDAGSLLEGCVPEERVFWNRRLREPGADWHWDTAEARMALGHLSRKRPSEDVDLHLFKNTVPGCWWDLWREQAAPESPVNAQTSPSGSPAKAGRRGGFGIGLLAGVAASAAVGWWALTSLPQFKTPEPKEVVRVVEKIVEREVPATAPLASALVEEAVPAPPIRESLRKLQSLLKRAPSGQSKAVTEAADAAPQLIAAAMRAPDQEPARPAASGHLTREEARKKATVDFASKHPEVARLVKMVRDGSFRENAQLIQGGSSVAAMGSPTFRHMIEWLILDPPERADSRLVVTKMALRVIPVTEVVPLFHLCYYEGSPNQIEIKECSQLLLELPFQDMKADHKACLQAIVGTP